MSSIGKETTASEETRADNIITFHIQHFPSCSVLRVQTQIRSLLSVLVIANKTPSVGHGGQRAKFSVQQYSGATLVAEHSYWWKMLLTKLAMMYRATRGSEQKVMGPKGIERSRDGSGACPSKLISFSLPAPNSGSLNAFHAHMPSWQPSQPLSSTSRSPTPSTTLSPIKKHAAGRPPWG